MREEYPPIPLPLISSLPHPLTPNRRGARVDDWGALEKRCGREVTVGSNPTLSA